MTCTLRLRRNVTCTFATRPKGGTRVRLARAGRRLASGVVRGRVVRMRARTVLRAGSYILTVTQGRGRSAQVARRAVKL